MSDTCDRLADAALQLATSAAVDYLRDKQYTDRDLCVSLRDHIKQRLDEALDDAREAADAGMHQIAVATFAASMRLAGIEAAKEVEHVRT